MSRIILIISSLFLTSSICTESIYSNSVITIEGVNKSLNSYQGKKLLIVTLPLEQNPSSDSLLHSLDSLRLEYPNSLRIIGVPAYEDGYTPSMKEGLKQWYRTILDNQIIVTEGIYTRKTSGTQQHALFRWLTDKNRNNHFDYDVIGPGNKFFVWTTGELVGVLGTQTKIKSNTLHDLLQ